jgi:hypothetical protein
MDVTKTRKQHQNKTVAYRKIYGNLGISYRLNKMFWILTIPEIFTADAIALLEL